MTATDNSRPAYPSIFACICTEIGRQYRSTSIFLKMWTHRVSGKYGNRDVNDAGLLPAKPIVER